jgi:hypothetical protein
VRTGRRLMGTATTLVAAIALLASCTSDDGGVAGSPAAATAAAAKIAFAPKDGATDVNVLEPAKITVSGGELTEATLTNPEGEQVEGAIAEDKKSWTSGEDLGYGKTYTYTAKAKNAEGKETTEEGSFTTMTPAATPRATINPTDDATVGVGMPISIKFPEGAPEDKAAVEKALKVETSRATRSTGGPRSTGRRTPRSRSRRSCTALPTAAARTARRTCPPRSPSAATRS